MPTAPGPAAAPGAPADVRERHVYEPTSSRLTTDRHYWRELWERRHFALELSRAEMDATHSNTAFGRLWLLLNPVLTASVYFPPSLLTDVQQHAPEAMTERPRRLRSHDEPARHADHAAAWAQQTAQHQQARPMPPMQQQDQPIPPQQDQFRSGPTNLGPPRPFDDDR